MKKGVRLLIALAAIVVVLGAYLAVQFEIFKGEEERPEFESTVVRLTDVEEENIERILIDNPSGQFTYIPAQEEGRFTLEMDFPVELNLREIGYLVDNLINLFANRTIEEDPEDPSVYGFDNPIMEARILEKDGTVTMITAGSTTPDKGSYYVRVHTDPAVYVVSNYYLERSFQVTNDFRPREMPQINLAEITYLKVRNEETIEIVPMTEDDQDARGATFSAFKIIQPYGVSKEMDSQFLQDLYPEYVMTPRIVQFIEDNPADLSPYGLEKDFGELRVMDSANELHLYFGTDHDADTVYAMYPDGATVFTLNKTDVALKDIDAFRATAKNIMLVNIEACDNFSITVSDGRQYNAAITRVPDPEDEEENIETYMLNGIPIDEKPFKQFYQKAIGISAHAVNPNPRISAETPFIDITYYLNTEPGAVANLKILEYDRNFYAVHAFGEATFLTAKEEVDKLLTSVEELLGNE